MSIISKKSWIQKITLFLLIFFFFFPVPESVQAAYSPGETLNPTCQPADSDCTVHSAAIVDADLDTQVHVEKSENANAIHFDLGGSSPIENALTINQTSGLVWNSGNNDIDFRLAGVNNDYAFYLSAFTDSIGIGTDAPANKLHVEGVNGGLAGVYLNNATPSDTSYTLYNNSGTLTWNGTALAVGSSVSGTTNYIPKFTASNSLGNSILYDDGTNIGIGTASPDNKLHVYTGNSGANTYGFENDIIVESDTSTGINILTGNNSTSGIVFGVPGDSRIADLFWQDNSEVLALETGTANGEIQFRTGNIEDAMRIDSSGNVGIGTTAPSSELDISTNSPKITLTDEDSGGTRPELNITNNSVLLFTNDDTALAGFDFYSKASNTRTYGSMLRIYGSEASGYSNYLSLTHTGDSGYGQVATAAGDLVLNPATGLVGIGTASPNDTLEVLSTSGAQLRLSYNTSNYHALQVANDGGNTWAALGTDADLNFDFSGATDGDFSVNSDNLFVDTSSGNVGIGVNIPDSLLELSETRDKDHVLGIHNTSASSGANASILLRAQGDSGGDAFIDFDLYGVGGWVAGLDNDDDNKFKITTGDHSTFGTTSEFVIDSSGNIGMSTSDPSSKLDIVDTTNQTALEITSSATTNNAVEITANSLTGGDALHVYSSSSDTSTRHLVEIFQQNANATNTSPLYVHSNDLDGNLVQLLGGTVTHNYQTTGGIAHSITADSLTTGTGFSVTSNSLTTGKLANFYSNSADINSRYLVSIHNDNSASTGTNALRVQQDAAQTAMSLVQNGNGTGLDIYNPGNTSAYGFSIHGNNHTTGGLAYHYSTSTDTSSRNLYSIINSSSAATGTTVLSLTQNSTGSALNIDGSGTTIGDLLDVDGDALTTGSLASFSSDSSDTSARNLVEIINDSAAADATTGLYIQQDGDHYALNIQMNGLSNSDGVILTDTSNSANYRDVVTIESTGGGNATPLNINQESNATAFDVSHGGTTTTGFYIAANSLTTGNIAYLRSTSTDTSSRNLVSMVNDSAAATGATVLNLQQDSTGTALDIDGIGTTTGDILDLDGDALTSGSLASFSSNSSDSSPRYLLEVINDNTSATNAKPLYVRQDAVGHALQISSAGTALFADSSSTVLNVVDINADSLTLGSVLSITSTSDDASNRNIAEIIQDSSLATGATAFYIRQDSTGLALDIDGNVDIDGDLVLSGNLQHEGELYDLKKTWSFDPGLVSTIYTQYLGTFEVDEGPVIIEFRDGGVNHGSSSKFEVVKQYGTGNAPIVNALDGSFYADYTIYYRNIDNDTYELFWDTSNTDTGNAIAYEAWITQQGTVTDSLSFSNDAGISASTVAMVANRSGWVGLGKVGPSAMLDILSTGTTDDGLQITADSLTTGSIASFTSASTDTSTRNLVEITNDDSTATGTTGLYVDQDANQNAIMVDMNGVTNEIAFEFSNLGNLTTGRAISAFSNSSNGGYQLANFEIGGSGGAASAAMRLVHSGDGTALAATGRMSSLANSTTLDHFKIIGNTVTTADVLDISGDGLTTGSLLQLSSDSSDTSSRQLIRLENNNSAATGTIGMYISQAADGEALYINAYGTTTDNAMFVAGNNLTTGSLASFDSDSDDTSIRNVFEIINDNATADSATALYIQQDGDEEALKISAGGVSTDDVFNITGDNLTSGGLARFYSNSSSTSSRNLVEIVSDNIAATNTNLLYLQDDGTNGGYLISGTSAGGGISMTTTGESVGYSFTHTTDAHHNVFNISGPSTDTGNILEVTGNALTSGAVARFTTNSEHVSNAVEIVVNNVNNDDSRALHVQNTSSNANAVALMTDGRVGINDPTPSTYVLTVDWNGDGNNYAYVNNSNAWTSGSADYAEYYYTKDTDLESGEAVCIDTSRENSVKRCENEADGNLMGIISTSPAFLGNAPGDEKRQDNPNYVIVAMLGQVPAKVTNENGAIETGDSLTSADKSGYIMKADDGDPTVGVALEGSDDTTDTINVLISRRNKGLTIAQMEEEISAEITKIEMEGLNFSSDTEQQQLSNMAIRLTATGQALSNISEQLALLQAELSGGEMALKLGELEISGGATLKSEVEFQGPAMFKALVQFIDEVVFKNDVRFAGGVEMEEELTVNSVTFNADTAGYAVIKEGDTKVEVIFEEEYVEVPVITATLRSSIKLDWYRVTDESEKGFVIEIDSKEDKDIKFAWTAIAVKDVKTTESKEKGGDEESEEEDEKDKEETTREEEVPTSRTSASTAETGDSSSGSKTDEDTDDESADEGIDEAENESSDSDESDDDESE